MKNQNIKVLLLLCFAALPLFPQPRDRLLHPLARERGGATGEGHVHQLYRDPAHQQHPGGVWAAPERRDRLLHPAGQGHLEPADRNAATDRWVLLRVQIQYCD